MSATMHIFFPLHCSCSLHIDPILLYIAVLKKIQNATFIYQAITIYVIRINMCLKFHICHMPKLLTMHQMRMYANIHATHELTGM